MMTTLKSNVTFTCNDKDLCPEEKLQTIYTEDDYDEATYGKGISIFDTGMGIEDAEERNNTSLDPLFLEDGIDVELLCQVRMLHQGIKEPTQQELENFDKLNDVMTIDNNPRDRKKFFVMRVSRDGNGTRKIIRNEEGNFEERIPDDKPDWLLEIESNEEKEKFNKKMKHKTKILWKQIREYRNKYKKCYALMERYEANGLSSYAKKYKKEGDIAYKEYKYYSNAMDKIKQIDARIEQQHKEREVEVIRKMLIEMQQKCPSKFLDDERLSRDYIVEKFKKEGFERTRYYLARLIKRLDDMEARRKYDEEHEAEA